MSGEKIDLKDYPLEEYGDKIVEALAEAGIHAGILIVAADLKEGTVASTSNMEDGGMQLGVFFARNVTEATIAPASGRGGSRSVQ